MRKALIMALLFAAFVVYVINWMLDVVMKGLVH